MEPKAREFWAQHGVRIGDVLTSINGRELTNASPQQVRESLARRPVDLTFMRSWQQFVSAPSAGPQLPVASDAIGTQRMGTPQLQLQGQRGRVHSPGQELPAGSFHQEVPRSSQREVKHHETKSGEEEVKG